MTINRIFYGDKLLEKIKEDGISIHILDTNFKSAFQSIDTEWMYEAMNEIDTPE
jgi:hypothetical protein